MKWKYLIMLLIILLLVPWMYAKNEKISSDVDITNTASQKILIHYTAAPTADNQNILKAKKGKVHRTFTAKPLKNILAAEIPGTQIESLIAADSSIKAIEPDYEVHALLSQSVPLITVPEVWSTYGATGKGVKVAVLDTGISDHSALTVQQHLSFNGESTGDFHGHGTHVAGIIASHDSTYKGVAPDVELYDLKVLNQYGYGILSDILAAIEWAIAHDIDIMSMSFGAWIYCDGNDVMSQMVDYAETQGVHSVVAAGNSGPSSYSIESPGCARQAITVGSTDKSDAIAYTSSRGPTDDARQKPDIVAPGVSITSLWNNGGFNTISGTSMATPHVTGAVALLLEDQGAMTRSQIISVLASTAKDLGYDGNTQGVGRIAVYDAFQKLHPIDNPPVISHVLVSPSVASSAVQISFDVSESSTTAVTVNEKPASFVSSSDFHYVYAYTASSADKQGTATISIRATDSAGQTGTATSTGLIIDTYSPTNAAVAINNDAATTSTPAVVLTLYATDATTGVATMAFSNDGNTYSSQESYTTTKQWTLSNGYSQKTVYVTFFDKAGNSAVASDTIEYISSSECSVDSDCASGETCTDGMCVPDNGSGNEQYIRLKEKLDQQYEQKLAELNNWYQRRLEELKEKYWTPEPEPTPQPEPTPEPEPAPEPEPSPQLPTQTTFGPIKYYETPQTWQFTVPSGISKVEVTTFTANNPSRLDAYGGWTAYLKINGIEMWENTPTTTTDYTTGQTYPVNAGYGLGKWVDVTKYVTSGTNSLTYYHFNEGDGFGVIVKITYSTPTGASITGFAIFPFLQKSNPCEKDTVLCIAFP